MNIRLFPMALLFGAVALVGTGCSGSDSNSTNTQTNSNKNTNSTVNATTNTANEENEEVTNEANSATNEESENTAGDEEREAVSVYLIALEDGGEAGQEVGCGDSLVPVVRPATDPGSDEEAITNALEELFAIKDEKYGESGLYSAWYQSDLSVDSVDVSDDGVATVELSGDVLLGGTCDTPRAKEQILSTVTQFSGVDTVEVNINGKPMDEALSDKE